MSKIPKLPIDEIHRDIKRHFTNHKYLTIVTEKDVDISLDNSELYVMTNYSREEAKQVLMELLESMITGATVDTEINSRDLKNLNNN